MKEVGKIFLIISFVFLSLFVSLNSVSAAPVDACTLITEGAGYASPYNYESVIGDRDHDAVTICNNCYICGVDDGVCPEDFGNLTQAARCVNYPDVDCPSNVEGTVTEAATGNVIVGAKVVISPPPFVTTLNKVTVYTDENGFYRTLNVTSGRWLFRAEKPGFDTEIKEEILIRGGTNTVNFALPDGSCTSDCTDSFGRCSEACQGVNNCNYEYPIIANLCDGRLPGSQVIINASGEFVNKANCCVGPIYPEFRPKARVYGEMDNLVTRSAVVTYNGEPVTIHFSIWD